MKATSSGVVWYKEESVSETSVSFYQTTSPASRIVTFKLADVRIWNLITLCRFFERNALSVSVCNSRLHIRSYYTVFN